MASTLSPSTSGRVCASRGHTIAGALPPRVARLASCRPPVPTQDARSSQPWAINTPCQVQQPRGFSVSCQATDPDKQASSWSVLPSRFNSAYLVIIGAYAALFALKNPYIFAALSIATIIPQNSTTTSLNSLVIFFYESGLFMNFAEAVYCVRLVTWLSILCSLVSFAVFA